jgi:hypothetical protein
MDPERRFVRARVLRVSRRQLVAWLVLFVVASAVLIAYITLVTLTIMPLVVWGLLAVVTVAASKLAQEMRQERSVPRDWYRHIAALHRRR